MFSVKECGTVPGVDNGLYTPKALTINSNAALECDDDYEPVDESLNITCISGGEDAEPSWSEANSCKGKSIIWYIGIIWYIRLSMMQKT